MMKTSLPSLVIGWQSTEALRMDKNTTKNFGREICDADREKAYYLIKHNPQADLCDAFWGIIKETILTQK